MAFWSCWNVFQVVLNHIHRYKKTLGIWSLGPKMRFLNKSWKILDLWVKSRNFCLKIIFWKVQVIGYIFHIYHLCSKWIFMELRAFEATFKIVVFYQNHLWKYCLRVHGKDSMYQVNGRARRAPRRGGQPMSIFQ